jgi:small subunit ribosomal protein S1
MNMKKNEKDFSTGEDFASLLDEYMEKRGSALTGVVNKGIIKSITKDFVITDVGLKTEALIPVKEFGSDLKDLKAGDIINVFIRRYEDKDGALDASYELANKEKKWLEFEELMNKKTHVSGIITKKVKGGFEVELDNIIAFLPGSQIDIKPVKDKDVDAMMGHPCEFVILKMDRERSNIVVSRRAIMEESRAEQRSEIMSTISEGATLEGIVKNITDYGVFVDLGGVDGLLHVTDISWKRINHPSEILSIGQTVKVKVIKFNTETQRISLGMKQLEQDPWATISGSIKAGATFTGRVTNIADYGAFVEITSGIEGLVHVSEMSWTKKNIHPSKIVAISQEVQVVVLEVDTEKRRISLGMKQCTPNPWANFISSHKVGDVIENEIRNITEFGLFIALDSDIDGMIHISDLSWDKASEEAIKEYKKGQVVKAKILEMDLEKERISLGIKQLDETRTEEAAKACNVKKGEVYTCVITEINDEGLEVLINNETKGFIKKSDLSREKSEQNTTRFAKGEKVDAKVISVDGKTGVAHLSIKAYELEEEKKAMQEYGNSDSGAVLGDILGAAMEKAKKEKKS